MRGDRGGEADGRNDGRSEGREEGERGRNGRRAGRRMNHRIGETRPETGTWASPPGGNEGVHHREVGGIITVDIVLFYISNSMEPYPLLFTHIPVNWSP